jgi:predicted component of type VI protein secretion system
VSAFIIVTGGELTGQRFEVGEQLTVGRESSDLTLPDTEASRHHAALRVVDGGIEVEDLHSLNGTWVDGGRLEQPVTLGDGATLRIGSTTMRVEIPAPASPPTRVAAVPGAPRTAAHAPTEALAPSPPAVRARGHVATRLWLPAAMTFAIIIATTIALLAYFATR